MESLKDESSIVPFIITLQSNNFEVRKSFRKVFLKNKKLRVPQ